MIAAMFQGLEEARKDTAELRRSIAELRESQVKTDLQIEKTSRKLDEVGKQLGSIGINMGHFAEELFYSSLKDAPVLGGIHYGLIECNIHDSKGKTEYDILLFNGDSAAVVEVKYKAHPSDIETLLEKKPKLSATATVNMQSISYIWA